MAALRKFTVPIVSKSICRQCQITLLRPAFAQPATRAHLLPNPQTFKSAFTAVRWHSTPSSHSKVYDFEQVKKFAESPSSDRILIDVREPNEVQEGYIPTAINIPIKSQPDALMLPEEEFEDRFGFSKPETDKEVVFYCRSGVRSSAAAQFAQQQGYKNVSEYRGSWLDWFEKGGPVSRP